MFNADFDNLGVELIKQNRLDLVSVLADCGDLKAKPKAIRSKQSERTDWERIAV